MGPDNFTEEDKKKVVDFLNMVATNGEFNLKIPDMIKFYGLLSFMQKILLRKIEANILEIKEVIEPKEETQEEGE